MPLQNNPAGVELFKGLAEFHFEPQKGEKGLQNPCAGVKAEKVDLQVPGVIPQDGHAEDEEHLVEEETSYGRIVKVRRSAPLKTNPVQVQEGSTSG